MSGGLGTDTAAPGALAPTSPETRKPLNTGTVVSSIKVCAADGNSPRNLGDIFTYQTIESSGPEGMNLNIAS